MACASLERAPLVVLTDAPAASAQGLPHQRLDQRALLTPVTKWSATLSAADVEELMTAAIACALDPPCGPVHVDCPISLQTDSHQTGSHQTGSLLSRVVGHQSDARLAVRFPLLLAGLEARPHARAIREFCASRQVPALVTYKAKGVMPDRDPWFAGVFTNGAIEASVLDQADLLITVGLDPVELLPRPWAPPQPTIAIDRDIPRGLRQAAERLSPSAWDREALQRTVAGQRQRLRMGSDRLTPDGVVLVAGQQLPGARVTVDAGAHMFPATLLWPIDEPGGMLISNGLSTMGFALPAAIGAAWLERDRPVVALIGDGGLLMCAGELLTLAREQLPVIVIVFSDSSLSLIEVKQRQRQLAPAGVSLGDVKWTSMAAAVGIAAHTATSEIELARAIAAGVSHQGPTLIEARVDPSPYASMLRVIRG